MSTPNFRTMLDFPLLVHDDFEIRVCPECSEAHEATEERCNACGASLSCADVMPDDILCYEFSKQLTQACEALTDQLRFHTVKPLSGYYVGIQLYAEATLDPHDMDNSDTHYYFDCCRSKAIKAFDQEVVKLRRMMRKLGNDYDMEEYACIGIFSNGEAFYQKASARQAGVQEHQAHAAAV